MHAAPRRFSMDWETIGCIETTIIRVFLPEPFGIKHLLLKVLICLTAISFDQSQSSPRLRRPISGSLKDDERSLLLGS
jgi:hypothetical protein